MRDTDRGRDENRDGDGDGDGGDRAIARTTFLHLPWS